MFRAAVRLGVKIGFGTDSAVSPHGINAKEFALMTGAGHAAVAALKSATSVDAESAGHCRQGRDPRAGKDSPTSSPCPATRPPISPPPNASSSS